MIKILPEDCAIYDEEFKDAFEIWDSINYEGEYINDGFWYNSPYIFFTRENTKVYFEDTIYKGIQYVIYQVDLEIPRRIVRDILKLFFTNKYENFKIVDIPKDGIYIFYEKTWYKLDGGELWLYY
ncbi:MAG: hypothetical protein NC921_03980 [Candidatus Omnitrophica bacterium]|nr:hypothetical protein [Candidatus Omnitrophota bacterium]